MVESVLVVDDEPSLVASLQYVGIVCTRSRLLSNVWADELAGDSRTVDVHVRRLRRHVGAGYLHTVRGLGYALRKP